MNQNIPIHYIDYGIGYFCNNNGNPYIELNKNLKKYPKLHQMILNHELGHNTNKNIDFMHDLKDCFNLKMQSKIFMFSLRHPRSLLSNLPIFVTKKEMTINWFLFAIWGGFLGLLTLGGILL